MMNPEFVLAAKAAGILFLVPGIVVAFMGLVIWNERKMNLMKPDKTPRIRRMLHAAAHATGFNVGRPVTWMDGQPSSRVLMTGFLCHGCGKVTHKSVVRVL